MKQLLQTKNLLFAFIALSFTNLNAQTWTWMKGANAGGQVGTYGTVGVSSVANTPGARVNAINWLDANDNLWLFGGQIGGGQTNDLWKFNTTTNEWTWMNGADTAKQKGTYGTKGVAAATNIPGGRYQLTNWIDTLGNFWMFGGLGYANKTTGLTSGGYLNDLWKYDPITNQWTWVSGDTINNGIAIYGTKGVADSDAKPSGRDYTASWIDIDGDAWVFGGLGMKGYLNDLWKYNAATNKWAWMSGDSTGNQIGIYGVQGVADTLNKPGGRADAAYWYDENNHCLWLFGGWGYDANNGTAVLNDLWKYDIATNEWTWVKGSNVNSQAGVYGAFGVPSSSNTPGARSGARCFKDNLGMLYLFTGTTGTLRFNDLWKYNIAANQWVWINGASTSNQFGIYGTQGISASSNRIGARFGDNVWATSNGDLWAFGGNAFAISGPAANINDLWKYGNYILSSVSSIENNNTANIYPNPNNGDFVIKLSNVTDKTIIEIYNSLGQKVLVKQTQSLENAINLQDQANGIYLIKILDDNNVISYSKIIKE